MLKSVGSDLLGTLFLDGCGALVVVKLVRSVLNDEMLGESTVNRGGHAGWKILALNDLGVRGSSHLLLHSLLALLVGGLVLLVDIVALIDAHVGGSGAHLLESVVGSEDSHVLGKDSNEGANEGSVHEGSSSEAPLHVTTAMTAVFTSAAMLATTVLVTLATFTVAALSSALALAVRTSLSGVLLLSIDVLGDGVVGDLASLAVLAALGAVLASLLSFSVLLLEVTSTVASILGLSRVVGQVVGKELIRLALVLIGIRVRVGVAI